MSSAFTNLYIYHNSLQQQDKTQTKTCCSSLPRTLLLPVCTKGSIAGVRLSASNLRRGKYLEAWTKAALFTRKCEGKRLEGEVAV